MLRTLLSTSKKGWHLLTCVSFTELSGFSRKERNDACINYFQVPVIKGNLQKREFVWAYAIRVLKVHNGRTKACGKSNNLKAHTLNYKHQAEEKQKQNTGDSTGF